MSDMSTYIDLGENLISFGTEFRLNPSCPVQRVVGYIFTYSKCHGHPVREAGREEQRGEGMQPPSWLLPRPVIIRSSSFCLHAVLLLLLLRCSCCVMMQLFSALSDFKGVAREQQ